MQFMCICIYLFMSSQASALLQNKNIVLQITMTKIKKSIDF